MKVSQGKGRGCGGIEVVAADGEAQPTQAVVTPAMLAHLDAYFAAKAAGMMSVLGVTGAEATDFVMSAVQELLRLTPSAASAYSAGTSSACVLADTGASVRVIGKGDQDSAVNMRLLSQPVAVYGSAGRTLVKYMADLPGYGGLMQGCLVMPDCEASLLPVIAVCEDLDLGYVIDQ